MKAYQGFIDVYTICGTEQRDLTNIPEDREEIFLKCRKDIDRETWNLGKAAWHNLRQYGTTTWYDWAIEHWGTKWNAYNFVPCGEEKLTFQTAWSAPQPILEKLSELYPDITFEYEWADEDIGCNCGRREYSGGALVDEYYPADGREALEFACGVWDYDTEEYLSEASEEGITMDGM